MKDVTRFYNQQLNLS